MSPDNRSSLLSPPQEIFHEKLAQRYQRSSMNKSHHKKSSIMHMARPRVFCNIAGCTSSFLRDSDLTRHKKTLHGPKQQCSYHGCRYATGRADKMNEHVRKIHKNSGSQANTSHLTLNTTTNLYNTEVLDEHDRTGYGVVSDQSILLTGCVDWMAQSWDVMNFAGDFDANFDIFGPFLTNGPAPPNCYDST